LAALCCVASALSPHLDRVASLPNQGLPLSMREELPQLLPNTSAGNRTNGTNSSMVNLPETNAMNTTNATNATNTTNASSATNARNATNATHTTTAGVVNATSARNTGSVNFSAPVVPPMNQDDLPTSERHINKQTVTEDWNCEYGGCETETVSSAENLPSSAGNPPRIVENPLPSAASAAVPTALVLALAAAAAARLAA